MYFKTITMRRDLKMSAKMILNLIDALDGDIMSQGEMAKTLGVSRVTVNTTIADLKARGFLQETRQGRYISYRLGPELTGGEPSE